MSKAPLDHNERPRKTRRWWRWLFAVVAFAGALAAVWSATIEVAIGRGTACLETRDHEHALTWLRLAERLSWERAQIHFLLARCDRRLGQFEQVQTHLRRAHELGWDVPQLEREQWLVWAQTNRFEQVSPYWSALFEQPGSDGPEISKAYVRGALAWFRLADARRVLDAWEADYPQDADPALFRAQLAETLRDWAGAAKSYRRVLELAPQRTAARLGLAQALIKGGELQAAEKELRQVVQEDPSHLEAQVLYAQSIAKLGRPDEAKELLQQLETTHPQAVEVLLELGNLELGTGQAKQALEHLQQAAKWKPESREVNYAYAKALQANGQTAAAAARFKFVDEAAKPLLQLKNLTDQLLKDPENLDVRFQIAAITWKYKSRDEGEKWFLSLLRFDPQHAPTHAALAIHYAVSGDEKQAAYHRTLSGGLEEMKKVEKVEPSQAAPQQDVEKAGGKN